MTNLDSTLKNTDITLPTEVHIVTAMVFPVVMYGCESWAINTAEHQKKLMLLTVAFGKTLDSPLDCKEIKSINPKGNQPCIFIGRNNAEAAAPILWPPDMKN